MVIRAKRIYEPAPKKEEQVDLQKIIADAFQSSISKAEKASTGVSMEIERENKIIEKILYRIDDKLKSMKIDKAGVTEDVYSQLSSSLQKFGNSILDIVDSNAQTYLTGKDKDECISIAEAMINEAVGNFDSLFKPFTDNFLRELESKADKEHSHDEFEEIIREIEENEAELEQAIEKKADKEHKHEMEDIAGLSETLKDFAKKDHKHNEYATVDQLNMVYMQRARGAGGGGHVVQDTGVVKAQRSNLNFIGATVTDDPDNNATVVTITGGSGGQASIQFEDEGSNLGTSGTVTEVDFTGAGVTASRVGNKVTVDITGGGGGGTRGSITGTLSDQTDLQTALDGKVDENAAITGATKTKITYDAKGLVTAGADATTADIADSTNKRYVTDAQLTVIGNTSGTNTGDQNLSGLVPYTGATADLNLGTYDILSDTRRASTSAGMLIESANRTDVGLLGVGDTANVTWYGNHNYNTATQDTIAIFTGAGKTLGSAATATYPSLTELTYVKGATSSIQTQLGARLPLAGGTMTGSITLGENTGIALDPAGSADGKWSGITIAGTAGYTQAFGDVVYLAAADSRWEACDADASATAGPVMVAMVVSAGTDGTACTLLLQGTIRADANFPALTIGAPVYISTTPGDIQVAAPSGTGDIVRILGYALTADEIYFNPSNTFIELV